MPTANPPPAIHQALPFFLTRLGNSVYTPILLLLLAIFLQAHLPGRDSPSLGYLLILLTILGLAAAILIHGTGQLPSASMTDRRVDAAPQWTALGAVAGVACGAIGATLVGSDRWNAQWWWLAAMIVPLLTLTGYKVFTLPKGRLRCRPNPRSAVEIAALFVVAMAARSINLTSSPPFLMGDEAKCGLLGRLFNAGQTPLLSISWYDLPMLSYAVSGAGMRVFGNSVTGLRLTNALIGSAGVLLTYQLGKDWFSRRTGILAAVILSFMFLHLELSRDGIHYIQGPTAVALTMVLCTVFIQRGGEIAGLLAGISVVLTVQVYWSARIIFLLVPIMFLAVFAQSRELLLLRRSELGWMVVGVVAAGLPVAALFHAAPGSFNSHQSGVSIFTPDVGTALHLISQYGNATRLEILGQQTWKMLVAFNSGGDDPGSFGPWGRPILDTIDAAVLPAALCLAILRWRRWPYLVCVAWIAVVFGASVVTIDPPRWGRLVSITPAVALLIAALLTELWQDFEVRASRFQPVVIAIVLALSASAAQNLYAVYSEYPIAIRQSMMQPTLVAQFLKHAPGASQTVLLSDGSMYVTYEPIQFLAPSAGGCTLMPGQPLQDCPITTTSKLFLLLPGRYADLGWLQKQRPGGKPVHFAPGYGNPHLVAYELP